MFDEASGKVSIEVVSPDNSRYVAKVEQFPFFVGRGDAGNHLALPDMRISRQCAALVANDGRHYVEDRGHRLGVFVNGQKITKQVLHDGDIITFGLNDSYKLLFHYSEAAAGESVSQGLGKLDLLLEATRLLHSQLPLEAVLHAMLDRAISITNAERGLLLEADATGSLRPWLARGSGSITFPTDAFVPSQTAVAMALNQKSPVITEDLQQGEGALNAAQSVIMQRLRTVIAIPLYSMPRVSTEASMVRAQSGDFLGLMYLDSRRPAAFSKLDRQILDAIAIESASILDNARLVKRELERQRIERELSIARDIQQALLPRGFRKFQHLSISAMNTPCLAVGGDYFDVFQMDRERTAFLIADVSGKGLGAALLTTMLQGALSSLTIGADPARLFENINRFICEHDEVRRYATMFFGTIDVDGNLQYLNAGHPSPLLLRRGEVSDLFTEGSFPVGLVPTATYSTTRARLEPGDTLVLFSDGVTEAADAADELFGVSRLQEVITTYRDAPLDQLQKAIVTAVEKFSGLMNQADDLTLLLVRYRGASQVATAGKDMLG
jgi:serine phosphatase RsbU (regulator of sigma subunit)